jgi:hypothetical protein
LLCKALGIRLSGPALGRPKADEVKHQECIELKGLNRYYGAPKRDCRECYYAAIHCNELGAYTQGSFLSFLHFGLKELPYISTYCYSIHGSSKY